ncbi:MAG TPA: 5-deoxy-glucuronate isomerase, partial [Terriglobales bacterium]|nr:5-deoxy-glucuronate isomerase [Terriglobales bacterium]
MRFPTREAAGITAGRVSGNRNVAPGARAKSPWRRARDGRPGLKNGISNGKRSGSRKGPNGFPPHQRPTGRHISVTPRNSAVRHLAYGRIILNATTPAESFATEDRETGLICLSGQATVRVGAHEAQLGPYDAIYIPRDASVEIMAKASVDFAEFSTDVTNHYPLQVVRFSEVSKDPGLKFSTGGSGCTRHLNMLLAENIEAGRLIAGFTDSEPGNWTSWPPHEHAAMLEEIYVYFNMPDPAFGIQ